MSACTSADPRVPDLLVQIIYRAGFGRNELGITGDDNGGGLIRLPAGLDPSAFKVRDLGYMLKAYGLPYEIVGPET
ncbi:hypothetical protein [Devosia sp.]|uniref:hypothetical protein n=1 Tax=Devosia sp. TaxID=1871048 RepID=UPI003F71923C